MVLLLVHCEYPDDSGLENETLSIELHEGYGSRAELVHAMVEALFRCNDYWVVWDTVGDQWPFWTETVAWFAVLEMPGKGLLT